MNWLKWTQLVLCLTVAAVSSINVTEEVIVCNTTRCQEAARRISDSIDPSTDPCQDFYQFACGGYLTKNPLPPTKSHYGPFIELETKSMKQLKEILETKNEEDFAELRNAKLMYEHCMRKEDNVQIMKKILEKLGGWPVVGTRSTNVTLEHLLAKVRLTLKKDKSEAIFKPTTDCDINNTQRYIIMLDQGKTPLGREFILDPVKHKDLNEAYRKFIKASASVLGAPESNDTDIQIDQIIEFERSLANLTSKPEDRRNMTKLNNPMTIGELQNLTDPDGRLNASEPVLVHEVKYVEDAIKFLESTDKRTTFNYVLWTLVKESSWSAGGKLYDANLEYKKVKQGIKEAEPRWLSCATKVFEVYGFAVGRPYVDKHFPSESKVQAEKMIESINEAFSERLAKVTFLDEATRKVAEEKSKAMRRLIGYPEWIHNDTAQHEYYVDFPNMTESFLSNKIGATIGNELRELKLLRKPVDKYRFQMAPAKVNAMYNPQPNAITFPAAILQIPFYQNGRPQAMNYGGIGGIVGHEITHGFDDLGSQFDKDGNLKKWWPANVRQAFINDTKCFIDQYSAYCPSLLQNTTKLCINGKATQGENIADNGGIEESFQAYKTWLRNNTDPLLPGLEEYSNEKLFFLNYANIWCTSYTPAYVNTLILSNPHSPHKYRVNGPLSNSKEFAKTFNCPPGPMNRDPHTCILW